MLDVELHGLDPAGHHLSNVLIRIASTLLLYQLFRRSTGAIWRSAFVAAVFGLHPLAVESVAWVAERDPALLDTLAAAYAAAGRFDAAIRSATRAAELASAQGDAALEEDVRARVALYRAGQPYVTRRDEQRRP